MITKSDTAPANIEDLTLFSCLDSDRYIVPFLNHLAKKDIVTIGDLLKEPKRDLFKEIPTSPQNRRRFKNGLKQFGINLN